MPGKYFAYYSQVADKMLPYLVGRRVAVEQRFRGSRNITYRRHSGAKGEDTWIRVDEKATLLDLARQYVEGIHANIRSEDQGAWFVVDIDSRELPLAMAQIAAGHAADVLTEQGLDPLIKFSGSDGFHLMWDVPDLADIDDDELWELERAVVRAVACEVERRLATDRAAGPIRDAVGPGKPAITTGSADRENPHALLFDEYILKDNANFRVPYSVHPRTGLVAIPLSRAQLETFQPQDASLDNAAGSPQIELPRYTSATVRRALDAWRADGC